MRRVALGILQQGAGLTMASPDRKGKVRGAAAAAAAALLTDEQEEGASIADQVMAPCFAALGSSPLLPPRVPRLRVASPALARLQAEARASAVRTQARSASRFFGGLISQWLLEDHPTQGCLSTLRFRDFEETEAFAPLYTALRAERDQRFQRVVNAELPRLTTLYGKRFSTLVTAACSPVLLMHRQGTLPKKIQKELRDDPEWNATIRAIPAILATHIEDLGDLSALSNDDPALPGLIAHLKATLDPRESDAHALIHLFLNPANPTLFAKLVRSLPRPNEAGSPRALIRLSNFTIQVAIPHFCKESPFLGRLSATFDAIDTTPLEASIMHVIHPEPATLSPALQTLIEQHLHHTVERFRLLPRLYALYANIVGLLRPYVREDQEEALQTLFIEVARLGATRDHISQHYRSTQAHDAVPLETRIQMRYFGQGVYLELGVPPPSGEAAEAEGANTLPNPGAFTPEGGELARLINTHLAPTPPIDPAARTDRSSERLRTLKIAIDQYKARFIDQEELLTLFAHELDALHQENQDDFIWNACGLIFETLLHAFSETQYFPSFVNHTQDAWSENKELLAAALEGLVRTSLDPERPLDAPPLTREDADAALAPLYREALALCQAATQAFYDRYKETGTLFYLINAWLGLHVASAVPRL